MFVQNIIKLGAAVHELSDVKKKNSAENNTTTTADSNKKTSTAVDKLCDWVKLMLERKYGGYCGWNRPAYM